MPQNPAIWSGKNATMAQSPSSTVKPFFFKKKKLILREIWAVNQPFSFFSKGSGAMLIPAPTKADVINPTSVIFFLQFRPLPSFQRFLRVPPSPPWTTVGIVSSAVRYQRCVTEQIVRCPQAVEWARSLRVQSQPWLAFATPVKETHRTWVEIST